MKAEADKALSVRCPTCGSKAKESCELNNGLPRTNCHQARVAAAEKRWPPALYRPERIALVYRESPVIFKIFRPELPV
jgi:hypothetical protein